MADDKKNPKVNKEIDDENLDKAAGGFADTNLVTKPVVKPVVTTFPENDGIFEELKAVLKK